MKEFKGSNNYYVGVNPMPNAGELGAQMQKALSGVVQKKATGK